MYTSTAVYALPPAQSNFSAPLQVFKDSQTYQHFAVGSFIFFQPDPSAQSTDSKPITGPLLLVLHRTSADAFGDLWDFPGGSSEKSDATIYDSAKREVLEETGLHVSGTPEFIGFHSWELKSSKSPVGVVHKCMKLCFSVTVEEIDSRKEGGLPEVKLAVDEHQAFEWIEEEDLLATLEGKEGARQYISMEDAEIAAVAFKKFKASVVKDRS